MAEPGPEDRIRRGQPAPAPTGFQAKPPEPDALPNLAVPGGVDDSLGGLAQSARAKQINTARTTLFVIGGLTIVVNLGIAFMGQSLIDTELRKQGINPQQLMPEQQTLVRIALMVHYAMAAGFVLLGVVFIGLGMMVRKYPVPCTIIGLALFLLGALVQLLLDPASLALGWIIKLIIVIALFKAVAAALAAEREKREALASMEDAD